MSPLLRRRHVPPAALDGLRKELAELTKAAEEADPAACAAADHRLCTRLAALSPNALLRSRYATLLSLTEPEGTEDLRERCRRQAALIDAPEARDRAKALEPTRPG
ncbi:FCD domain-containing protein [Streptomyces sp. NPDC052396]|uniref:FCD domain-containing protein n=1 Tax=Streptomyces sp. NPDC052396 TaxID=3365689 RepID=UPI0037D2E299